MPNMLCGDESENNVLTYDEQTLFKGLNKLTILFYNGFNAFP